MTRILSIREDKNSFSNLANHREKGIEINASLKKKGFKLSLDSFVETEEEKKSNKRGRKPSKEEKKPQKTIQRSEFTPPPEQWNPQWFQGYSKSELYDFLCQTAERSPLFPNYVAWTRKILLAKKPQPGPQEIASLLGISLGEAYVILDKIAKEKKRFS
jgi:hypothetical protein